MKTAEFLKSFMFFYSDTNINITNTNINRLFWEQI